MSSKSAIKFVVADDAQSTLFKWVAILTGSKNALKGVGFFVGGLLLYLVGFREALFILAGTGADRAGLDRPADEGRPRHGQQEGEVRPDVLEQPGRQRARGGPRLPVRLARRVVRRRPAGLPVHGAGLELLAGGRLPGRLDHRLRHRAGQRPGILRRFYGAGQARPTAGPRPGWRSCSRPFPAGIAVGAGGRRRSDPGRRRSA